MRPGRIAAYILARALIAGAVLPTVMVDAAVEPADAGAGAALRAEAADVTRDLVELKRDIRLVEDELLYPPSSKVAVYVSVAADIEGQLDAVQLKLNGRDVASRVYDAKAFTALTRGGVDRVYLGNAPQGDNVVVCRFQGRRADGKDFSRDAEIRFEKAFEPIAVEFEVTDTTTRGEPDIVARMVP